MKRRQIKIEPSGPLNVNDGDILKTSTVYKAANYSDIAGRACVLRLSRTGHVQQPSSASSHPKI